MSVVPRHTAASPAQEPFFSQASTRLDIVKFLIPFVVGFSWFLISTFFAQQAQSQELRQQAAKIEAFQNAKEMRGERLIVVETKLQALQSDVTEMRGDIKTLLQRIPAK
ncbi:MAG: hypothetical protein V4671_04735 [Armatimonadota bacterium]